MARWRKVIRSAWNKVEFQLVKSSRQLRTLHYKTRLPSYFIKITLENTDIREAEQNLMNLDIQNTL